MANYTKKQLLNLKERALSVSKENNKYLYRLSKQKPKNLDRIIQQLHNEEFSKIDCISCANCCRTISPMIFESDIQRIASALKMRIPDFKDRYILIDEEGDYIFNTIPCPFLEENNYCSIYVYRPKACREYPHTDRKKFYQVLAKTYKNTFTCPAVFNIVRKLPQYFP